MSGQQSIICFITA